MPAEVTHERFEYRIRGGEIQRKPVSAEGLSAWAASWLVLDKASDFIPPIVLENLQPAAQAMRFD